MGSDDGTGDSARQPVGGIGSWLRNRREKAIAEIERNRRGDYRVPTWVLVVILVVLLGSWIAVIAFS